MAWLMRRVVWVVLAAVGRWAWRRFARLGAHANPRDKEQAQQPLTRVEKVAEQIDTGSYARQDGADREAVRRQVGIVQLCPGDGYQASIE
jgi:hypothetical protein